MYAVNNLPKTKIFQILKILRLKKYVLKKKEDGKR